MTDNDARERPIAAAVRSGVLYPNRLTRYAASWPAPDPAVSAVVDQYWHVSWALDEADQLDQPIIDLPAVTLTVEEGAVPALLVVTGVHGRDFRSATGLVPDAYRRAARDRAARTMPGRDPRVR